MGLCLSRCAACLPAGPPAGPPPRRLEPRPALARAASPAVLWLLLLTAGVIKWAQLSPAGDKALAAFQLAMSSGVGFALGCAVVWSGVCLLRQCLLRRAAKRRAQRSSFGSASDGGASSRRSAAAGTAALFAHSRLGSGVALGGDAPADAFNELPLRLLSKRGSLLNLAAAAGAAAAAQAGASPPVLHAASSGYGAALPPPPPPLVGLQRDSTAATGTFFSAASSFKRGSSSLCGLGTSTDAGEIGAGRHSCGDALADPPLADLGSGCPAAHSFSAEEGSTAICGDADAVVAVTTCPPASYASAAGSDGSCLEAAPLLPVAPGSEPLMWR